LDRFARIILGYHGAKAGEAADFARGVLVGDVQIEEWRPSENEFDWLGHGIYFWEHSPERARRWAADDGVVIGAVIQLGRCLDLTDLRCTQLLTSSFPNLEEYYREREWALPENTGRELKSRKLDCTAINYLVDSTGDVTTEQFQTVRGAFEEGDAAFPGSMIKKETHIQIAVRDRQCVLGVFRPVG
jgi:hypothetical protein